MCRDRWMRNDAAEPLGRWTTRELLGSSNEGSSSSHWARCVVLGLGGAGEPAAEEKHLEPGTREVSGNMEAHGGGERKREKVECRLSSSGRHRPGRVLIMLAALVTFHLPFCLPVCQPACHPTWPSPSLHSSLPLNVGSASAISLKAETAILPSLDLIVLIKAGSKRGESPTSPDPRGSAPGLLLS
ncbi:hypothetical protein NDU88_003332 [Pleurodeles waltl]|uniref:Uncharacterized protein n=1 Tax=Pleurodeles waltl TaxID=8319 RepID=A0AAV7LIJ3_PLEWA|nr:hypothetical protein NDU88_003332 [Pleurodeles waltl]